MTRRSISAISTALGACVVCACSLENKAPEWDVGPANQQQQQQADQVITRPLIDPTESEGRICTDSGPVVGRAQPGSTVVAQGPGGESTARAGSDGRFCVAVPLAKGRQNLIEVYSVHEVHGTSEVEVITLTHAGLGCPSSSGAPAQPEPQPSGPPEEQLGRIVQVRASIPPKEGSDRAMIDGDPKTYTRYQAWSWKLWQSRSDEMWVWFTLSTVAQIKAVRIHWRDSLGRGNMYADKLYVGVSPAEDPGDPPPPPTSSWVLDTEPTPAATQWEWIGRHSSMNADGADQEIDMGSQLPAAQHIALWLEADANDASWSENYAISEVEVVLYTPSQSDTRPVNSGSTSVCGVY